jgi:cellulose synthase/poly-beta-1,6-N-acetylglucosamine synthase-like glycosyltransferase
VIDKEHGGKADSQNGALNICSSPLFLILDIDTIIEEDALLRMIRPFVTKRGVCGEGATIRVLNGCKVENGKIKEVHIPKSILPGIQVGEYLRAFLYGRLGWNYLGGNFIVSGAFGLFDKAKAMKVGGYDTNIVAEDMDITMSMISHFRGKGEKCFFRFIPDPMAWTEVPSTINSLGHQRERWHRGLVFVLQKHWKMFLNPRHGLTGLVAMPYLVFAEFLQPVLELTYYFAVILGFVFGVITFKYFLLFLVVVMGISLILTLSCIIMEQLTFKRYKLSAELFLLLLYATFENLGYRQFYFFWKMWGIVKAVRNVRRDEHFG